MKKPKEYLEGKVTFCGFDFYIDDRAYIPNIETEQLVRLVIEDTINPLSIVDVGTGSGCIAVCLAKQFPNATVHGIDIDKNALEVAKKNIEIHQTKNIILHSDNYIDNLHIQQPDVIVANLPWGDENHLLGSNTLEKLAFEPKTSAFHPKGILGAYSELIHSILSKKWKTTLYFESGVIPKNEVGKIMPSNVSWKYIALENYSVTKVVFT